MNRIRLITCKRKMFCFCIVLLIAAQGLPDDTHWTEDTNHYSISVYYPASALENGAVGEKIKKFASEQIKSFKELFMEYFKDYPLLTEWNLDINFIHEPSPDSMICILAWMWSYTGGPHGNSWTRAFIFDLSSDSFIGPVELLGGQTEFESFVEEVTAQLLEILDDEAYYQEGAYPTPENYHSVLPVPDENGGIAGYTVIFPPYQVACYARGPVEVYVPADRTVMYNGRTEYSYGRNRIMWGLTGVN